MLARRIGREGRRITVGKNGNFNTLADAIAYLETQEHFVELSDGSASWSMTDPVWNQGSDKLSASSLGADLSQAMTGRPTSLWLKIDGDAEEYSRIHSINNPATTRYNSNFSAAGVTPVSILAPIFHTIVLLDPVLDEDVIDYDTPMNISIVGANSFIMYGSAYDGALISTSTRLNPTANALYGNISFENLFFNGPQGAWGASGYPGINTSVEIKNSRIIAPGQDWMALVRLGTLKLLNTDIELQQVTGAGHFFQILSRGRIIHKGGTLRIRQRSVSSRSSLWTSTTASHFLASNIDIIVEDYTGGSNGFKFFSGSRSIPRTVFSNINVYGSDIGGAAPALDIALVEGFGETAPTFSPNIPDATCDIVNCAFTGKFDPTKEAVLYKDGGVGTRVDTNHTVNIVNSKTATLIGRTRATTTIAWKLSNGQPVKDYGLQAGFALQIEFDLATSLFAVTLGSNPLQLTGVRASPGVRYVIKCTQDGTGGRVLSFGSGINSSRVGAPGSGTADQTLYAEGIGALDGSGGLILLSITSWA